MQRTAEARVLVAYATKKGSTKEVAEAVADVLREHGADVDFRRADDVTDVGAYEAVVLGGALYMGRWHSDAQRFLLKHRNALSVLPVFVFGMGPQTLEEKDVAGSRGQLDGALARVPEVEPVSVAIFGGVVDPAKLHFPFNRMSASDARDWDAIRSWAEEVSTYCRPAIVGAPNAVGARSGEGG
jgi:menaquinone-dependent protoporphyrinogen oxidase